jgi:glycogen synthase
MVLDGMKMDFSWRKSAERYIEIYRSAIKKKALKGISYGYSV